MELHCPAIICGGPEFNYSSEGAEATPPFFAIVYPPVNPPPLDTPFSATGCLYLCASYISQEDADLCALRQAVLCTTPPEDIWFSAPATCAAPCPDGSVFYYTVPAGMFIARTYEEALAQAQAYACQQAQQQRFCIGELPRCACVGNVYSGTVGVDVDHSALTWTMVGNLPPGLSIISDSDTATIVGTPALLGTYAFQLVATDASGNYAIKTFTIQVIEVTTTSLPDFVIGVAYSYQLTADGGSGNYAWTIITGTLPDGIDISSTGLLSGTPTVSAVGASVTFGVVDVTCETIQNPQNPPRVSLITASTTTIRTKRGWAPYDGSSSILYKRVDVSGSFKQEAATVPLIEPLRPGGDFCAGAIYTYDGFSQIDTNGNFISRHTKNLSKACPNPEPTIRAILVLPDNSLALVPGFGLTTLIGYCWEDDPGSCSVCVEDQTSWIGVGNFSVANSLDFPTNMIRDDENNATVTATSWSYAGTFVNPLMVLIGVTGFPFGKLTPGGISASYVSVASDGSFSFTLSEEFTDADAIATQIQYNSNGKVTENKPNYRTWTTSSIINRSSRTTSVTYALNFTNLIPGESYLAAVEYWSSTGTRVTVPFSFTAAASTHVISGLSVPTPSVNNTITVKNPRVIFAP